MRNAFDTDARRACGVRKDTDGYGRSGQKFMMAEGWGIWTVSHLWLFDSIVLWSWRDETAYSYPGTYKMLL